MYGKKVQGVIRSTVWIGPDGVVRKHWARVPKAEEHPARVLEALEADGPLMRAGALARASRARWRSCALLDDASVVPLGRLLARAADRRRRKSSPIARRARAAARSTRPRSPVSACRSSPRRRR